MRSVKHGDWALWYKEPAAQWVEATIHAKLGKPCTVRYGDRTVCPEVALGDTCRLDGNLQMLSV